MKKSLLAIIGLTVALSSAVAQATLGAVNLNNNFTPAGASAKAYILNADGTRLTKDNGMVEVLDATGAVIKSGAISSLAGVFSFGVTDIPGTSPGGNGSIQIRAWDKSTGADYATATSKAISSIITLTGLGGGNIPAPTLASIGNFTGLTLVASPIIPEPSTVALAALGLAGLFFVARRK